jgi:N-acetyl-alpha-D-glucosaminyl L-malate synthase BshA
MNKRKMKIGIVCYPTFGGSGVVATELGKALASEGHQIHFITYSQPFRLNHFNENLFYHEVSVSNYPLFEYQPYESALASKLVDVVKYEKLDLLHVHYAIPHASAALMAKNILFKQGINIPFITTLHGTDITLVGKDPCFEPVIKYSIEESDAVTAVSQSLKNDTQSIFKIKNEIHVIPNFIDITEYENISQVHKCHRKYYSPNGEKIIVHVSNFRAVKRVDDVLRVFDRIRKKIPSKLILIGDGPERSNIEKLCRELNTCNDIHSVGKIIDPKELLCIGDLFILPSETESFGLAALEAMAMKIPVISSNTGGLPEVNLQGETGYLSEVGNVDEMAENAISILTDENKLNLFKQQAFQQAAKYDIKNIIPLYEKLYHQVINQ